MFSLGTVLVEYTLSKMFGAGHVSCIGIHNDSLGG